MHKITVLGAGLVGSLLSILLARKGNQVALYEKRPDLRKLAWDDGRTINLALSERGWRALDRVGLADEVKKMSIPMPGRMMHDVTGKLTFQPYGADGQCIYSVSRRLLNELLLNVAEQEKNLSLHFEQKCTQVDLTRPAVFLTDAQTDDVQVVSSDILIGADGAFSAVRSTMQRTSRFNYSQHFIEHGYKELTIPPKADGSWVIDPNALHIWPRGNFMLIALPNPDGSFTCTLFFPYEGNPSFGTVRTREEVKQFFETHFPDILPLMPDVPNEYLRNPTSALVTIRCYPWSVNGKVALIGDASHAIVPFYGQGMNAGFEDCVVLEEMIERHGDNWKAVLSDYEKNRFPDAEAIADLALANFIEMRDKVADPKFLLRKKIEAHLSRLFPDQWTPVYSMIAFSNEPYAHALHAGKRQDRILQRIMQLLNIEHTWQELDYTDLIKEQ